MYPCRSIQSSHGMESPMLSTPLSRNSSSSIHLNSSGVVTVDPPASLSRYFLPSTMRVITFRLTVDR
uniref:Uncharacterized protein n=1 Tax=Arundo donax TaxID=35708 RepID=A0A0A8ZFB1_ARUDO